MNSVANISQPGLAHHDSRLLDLAFAMDTTGSMGSYIHSARDNIRRIVEDIVAKESSDIRMALVEYRDHPPQEETYVTQVHDFTPRVAEMKKWLEASKANGGGDTPEAVADALHDVLKLSWRPEATKICVLVSDAPPHGLQHAGDKFPNGCPVGNDPMNIVHQLAEKGVTLYVAGCEPSLTPYKDFFAAMAYVTGGQYVPLSAAGALTAVIVGGAQEELSLEQWMEQVNQQVMQEVQAHGEANVNVDELSREVMGRLNMAGARSKRLQVNQAALAPASAYVQGISQCQDMKSLRAQWKPPAGPKKTERGRFGIRSPPPPDASRSGFPAARHAKKKCTPQPRGRLAAGAPMEPDGFMGTDMDSAPVGAAADMYDTTEGEIQMGQAQRLVQKALKRNNISIPRK